MSSSLSILCSRTNQRRFLCKTGAPPPLLHTLYLLSSHVRHCPTIPYPANMGRNIIPPLHLAYPTFPYELCITERWSCLPPCLWCDGLRIGEHMMLYPRDDICSQHALWSFYAAVPCPFLLAVSGQEGDQDWPSACGIGPGSREKISCLALHSLFSARLILIVRGEEENKPSPVFPPMPHCAKPCRALPSFLSQAKPCRFINFVVPCQDLVHIAKQWRAVQALASNFQAFPRPTKFAVLHVPSLPRHVKTCHALPSHATLYQA